MSDFRVGTEENIQNAIDSAASAGGGKVILEPGLHKSKTIILKSNVELHFENGAVLQGPPCVQEYPVLDEALYGCHPTLHSHAMIAGAGAENISITGSGIIDGQGPLFYDRNIPENEFFYRKPSTGRPRLIQLANCRNVRIEDVEFHDSPGWTSWFIECENLTIRHIRILGDPRMINNDGIHLFGGRHVIISDCIISTGDDCIVLRAGHAWKNMDHTVATEDVAVTNCILESSCQGVRVGCSCDDTVRRCRFSNLSIRSKNVGIYLDNPARYLKDSAECVPETVEDVSFDHIHIESETKALAIEVEEGVRLNGIRRISFANIDFVSREPVCVVGSKETHIEDVRFSNIRGKVSDPETLRTRYADKLVLDHVEIERSEENVRIS